jgi:tape measure domain-containing protein|nr:MAG TPA: Minor tail protein [Caudoviricetes sp.]
MATEIGAAYLMIMPSMKGAKKAIESSLNGVNVEGTGKKWGASLVGGIGGGFANVAKVGVGAVAAIGAAVGGLAIGGGISRALKIEQANASFKAMGIDAAAAMKSANDAVSGTAFGLDAAAQVAASLGVSGVAAGEEMTKSLKAVAGMASLGGVEMERVGAVMGKVAAQGRLQGDELMQLSEMGVPALQMLAKHLGLTTAETQKMVSKGEIDFQTFSDAMYGAFGEAAKGANETFSGAMSNVRAALSRVGAAFASPALDALRKVFVALIPAIDAVGKALEPAVAAFAKFAESVSGHVVAGIEAFTSVLTETGSPLQAFKAAFAAAFDGTPIGSFISWLTGCISLFQMGKTPVDGFKLVLENLKNTIGGITSGGGLQSFLASLPQPIQSVIAKIQELASSPLGGFLSDMAARVGVFGGAFALFLAKFGAPLQTAIGGIAKVFGSISAAAAPFGGVMAMIGTKLNTFRSAVTLCGGGVKGLVGVLGGGLRGALMGLFNPVTLVVGVIAALVAAFVSMMATNEGFRNSVMGIVSSIGAGLAPILTTVGTALQQLAAGVLPIIMQLINALVPVLAQIVMVVLQVAAALAPVIATIVGIVVPILTQIITLVVQVVSTIIAAVLPVITAILTAIQTAMPTIQSIITTVMGVIQSIIQTVWPIIQSIITIAANAVMAIITAVMPVIQGIITTVMSVVLSIIQAAWPAIQAIIETVMGVVQGVIDSVWPAIQGIIEGAMSVIQGVITAVMQVIQGDWEGAWNTIKTALSDAWESIKTGVQDGIDAMMGFIQEIPGKVTGFFSDAGSWLLDAGSNIIGGLIDGIKGAIDGIGDALGGISDYIVEHKGPPSYDKVMLVPAGRLIMGSLVKGFGDGMPALEKTLGGINGTISGFASDLEPFDKVSVSMSRHSTAEMVSRAEEDRKSARMIDSALKELGDRIENMKVVMDSGELVGATAAKYDRALSRRQLLAERGF